MTPEQIEAERVAFEAWFGGPKTRGSHLERYLDDGDYCFGPAYHGWSAWLARAELIHARYRAGEELIERQESQRVAMAEKHERGE